MITLFYFWDLVSFLSTESFKSLNGCVLRKLMFWSFSSLESIVSFFISIKKIKLSSLSYFGFYQEIIKTKHILICRISEYSVSS